MTLFFSNEKCLTVKRIVNFLLELTFVYIIQFKRIKFWFKLITFQLAY